VRTLDEAMMSRERRAGARTLLARIHSSVPCVHRSIRMKIRFATLAFLIALLGVNVAPAFAQTEVIIVDQHGVPAYDHWQAAWDRYEFDRHHVILGSVTNFAPYRLQIARRDGFVQTIDLKNGTVILPTGATPAVSQRVAVIGYYSHGTFIANRVLLRY
jgi:hypothetical protein